MTAHAVLSPSAAERWLNCTPSARLEQEFPDKGNQAADEGTLAHALGELLIRQRLARISEVFFANQLDFIQASKLYEAEMYEYCDQYATFVMEKFSEAQSHTKDALLFLEQKLNLTDYIPDGFGTGDVVIIADKVLEIVDLKYGKGVPVSAERNKQMMLYALGALREFDFIFDIAIVRMTIYQPRLDSVSTYEMSVEELREWAETELIPRAALAFDGIGHYVPGPHCRFCKAKAVCKAHAQMNLELAKYDFLDPALLTDYEIADILKKADAFTSWITSVQEHALTEAVNNNKEWPGYKLVEGRSNREYLDEQLVAQKLVAEGIKEEKIYSKKLLGITAMEKGIGKKVFSSLLSDLVVKPPGKPTLVTEDDKRPAYNSYEAAKRDFSNI